MIRFALALLIMAAPAAAFAQAAGEAKPAETATEPPAPLPGPQLSPDDPAPYDTELLRLATVLGSLHYLRNLCGDEGNAWREEMNAILRDGAVEGQRKRRMIAAFNDGYRAFSSSYVKCSQQAADAAEAYRVEGAALASQIVQRFRN